MKTLTSQKAKSFLYLILVWSLPFQLLQAQGYINHSTYIGGSDIDLEQKMLKTPSGETYIFLRTSSPNLPVTNGSSYSGGTDIYISKYDANNNFVLGAYFGSLDNESLGDAEVYNGDIYIMGLSGTGSLLPNLNSFSVTEDGDSDIFFAKLDPNGNPIFTTAWGGTNTDNFGQYIIQNGEGYWAGDLEDVFPIVNGLSTPSTSGVAKFANDGTVVYSSYLNCNINCGSFEEGALMNVDNGEMIVYNYGDVNKLFRFDNTGNVVYDKISTVIPAAPPSTISQLDNGNLYFMSYNGGAYSIIKVAPNGDETLITNPTNQQFNNFEVIDDIFYFAGDTQSSSPTTDGTTITGGLDAYYGKIDLITGNLLYASLLGGSTQDRVYQMKVINEEIYFYGQTYSSDFPVTNSSNLYGGSDLFLVKINAANTIELSTYIGSSGVDGPRNLIVGDNTICITGHVFNNDYPVTNNSSYQSGYDVFYTEYKLCPDISLDTDDMSTPTTQTTCFFGLAEKLVGTEIGINGDNFASLYRNGIAEQQTALTPFYQWQKSDDATGPWEDIPEGILQDFLPPSTGTDQYYRRVSSYCGDQLSMSNVSAVLISDDAAPTIDPGSDIYTCPGQSIMLGGTPTATGGSGNYTYLWDNDAGNTANPMVTPTETSVYTVTVTDDMGCEQIGQVVVNVVSADAGPDVSACAGEVVRIGAAAEAGLSGITYSWLPVEGLSCTDCAQPFANPLETTVYTVSMTIPYTGGGTCTTSDEVAVNVVDGPSNTEFAGPDRILCLGEESTLGFPIADVFEEEITAVSQSSVNGAYLGTIGNLTDGDYTTGARTLSASGGFIQIDLGVIKNSITRVQLAAIDANNLNGRRLQYSTDGTSWYTFIWVMSGVSNTALTDFNAIAPVDARYIRVYYGTTGIIDLSEIKVFSTFKFTWAPGNYLSSNNRSTAIFRTGNINLPESNPITYYLTTEKDGCIFVDDVKVAVIEARAGTDGCGPRVVGLPDRTPDIEETYSWVKISGPGTITGDNNTVQTTVSSSGSGTTIYELTTSYTMNGISHSCTDEVIVPPCGGGCDIQVVSNDGCSIGPLTLRAFASTGTVTDPNDFNFSWSPSDGLSSTTGQTVQVLDNVHRTYTVTITTDLDPDFTTTCTKEVSNPDWSFPTFTAVDDLSCPDTPINIGNTLVEGYEYEWSNGDLIADPSVSPSESTDYFVTVTDTGSGCTTIDTASIQVQDVIADAGEDWVTCNNAIIELGTTAQANHSYSWSPAVAPWQPGSNQFSAQPQVLISTDIEFIVTVTNTLVGCTKKDTVQVTVSGLPPSIDDAPDVSICENDPEGVVIGSPAINGLVYKWSPEAGLSCTDCAQPIATPNADETYTLSVTYAGGCTLAASDQVEVTVDPEPTFTLNDINYCPSDGAVQIGNDAPADMESYSWSPEALLIDANVQNPSTLNTPPNTPTTFTLTVENSKGCQSSDDILITPNVNAPLVSGNKAICLGASTTIGDNANTTGANIEYSWTPAADLDDATSINPTFTPTGSGIFIFTVEKDDNDCISTETVTITVKEFNLPIMAPISVCQNASIQIGVTPQAGVTYIWSPTTGLSNPNIANPIATMGTSSQTYTLTAIGLNGCPDIKEMTINVAPVPAPTASIPDINTCLAYGSVPIDANISPSEGNYSYLWSPNDGSVSNIYIKDPTINLFSVGEAIYTFTVTDNDTGCSSTEYVNVNVSSNCANLPVEWNYFDVSTSECTNTLRWGTASETNSQVFIIERSSDGDLYTAIGSVSAAGESTEELHYTFEDNSLGSFYYRIKQVDFDATFEYSAVEFIKGTCELRSSLVIYPNPVHTTMNIRYKASEEDHITMIITNLHGKMVYHQASTSTKGLNHKQIPVDQLDSGVYFLILKNKNNPITRKIIITNLR